MVIGFDGFLVTSRCPKCYQLPTPVPVSGRKKKGTTLGSFFV